MMTSHRQLRNLALIGFMGSGKSCVGRQVAAQLRFDFVDTDQLIEARAGCTIAEVFARSGELVFRQLERQVVEELAARDRTVIATGGGLAAFGDNLEKLKEHALVVCLWASPKVIWERTRSQSHRPLLKAPDPLGRIRELLAAREPYYRRADILVGTDTRPLKEVVFHVRHQFELARREAQLQP
jgi:shikimate kinase